MLCVLYHTHTQIPAAYGMGYHTLLQYFLFNSPFCFPLTLHKGNHVQVTMRAMQPHALLLLQAWLPLCILPLRRCLSSDPLLLDPPEDSVTHLHQYSHCKLPSGLCHLKRHNWETFTARSMFLIPERMVSFTKK